MAKHWTCIDENHGRFLQSGLLGLTEKYGLAESGQGSTRRFRCPICEQLKLPGWMRPARDDDPHPSLSIASPVQPNAYAGTP